MFRFVEASTNKIRNNKYAITVGGNLPLDCFCFSGSTDATHRIDGKLVFPFLRRSVLLLLFGFGSKRSMQPDRLNRFYYRAYGRCVNVNGVNMIASNFLWRLLGCACDSRYPTLASSDADNELVCSIGIDLHIFLIYFIEFNHLSCCQQTQPIASAPTRHWAMYLSQRAAVKLLSVAGRRSIDSNDERFALVRRRTACAQKWWKPPPPTTYNFIVDGRAMLRFVINQLCIMWCMIATVITFDVHCICTIVSAGLHMVMMTHILVAMTQRYLTITLAILHHRCEADRIAIVVIVVAGRMLVPTVHRSAATMVVVHVHNSRSAGDRFQFNVLIFDKFDVTFQQLI